MERMCSKCVRVYVFYGGVEVSSFLSGVHQTLPNVYMCACVLVFVTHQDLNIDFTSKMRTFLQRRAILAGLHKFKGLL